LVTRYELTGTGTLYILKVKGKGKVVLVLS